MHLPTIERHRPESGPHAETLGACDAMGVPAPGILHLFAWRPEATEHLARFTQAVMRGPSELAPGLRELIAAFVSGKNDCLF